MTLVIDNVIYTDVRYCRMFGRGLVLRGCKHFKNNGVSVSTQEDIPNPEKYKAQVELEMYGAKIESE